MRFNAFRTCTKREGGAYRSCLSGILSQDFNGPVGNDRAFFLARCCPSRGGIGMGIPFVYPATPLQTGGRVPSFCWQAP